MLKALEAVTVHALLLQRPNDPLDHPVLLGAVGRDELLLQSIAPDQPGIVSNGKNQAIVRPQQEGVLNPSQAAVTGDQSLLEGGTGGRGLTGFGELRTEQFAGVAIDYQGQGQPAVTPAPDTAEIGRPALIRGCRNRRYGIDSRPIADGPLPDLPALELEDPLDRVLVEAEQIGHRPIAERGLLLDQGPDGLGQGRINLWRCPACLVVDAAPGNAKPAAQLADGNLEAVCFQSLPDGLDHGSSLPSRNWNFFRALSSSMASP